MQHTTQAVDTGKLTNETKTVNLSSLELTALTLPNSMKDHNININNNFDLIQS